MAEPKKMTPQFAGKKTLNEGMNFDAPKYAIAGRQAGRYERTTKALAEYAGKTYGYEMKRLIAMNEETDLEPPALSNSPSKMEELAWGKEYDMYLRQRKEYQDNKAKVFAIIYSQCDEPLKNRLETCDDFIKADKARDVISLLKLIKKEAYEATDRMYTARQAVEALQQLVHTKQGDREGLLSYYKRYTSVVEMAEATYGPVNPIEAAKKLKLYSRDRDKAIDKTRRQMLAYLFMQNANQKYKPLLDGIHDDFTLGDDRYPDTIESAYEILEQYARQHKLHEKRGGSREDKVELNFAQMSKTQLRKHGLCFKCKKKWTPGHGCEKTEEIAETETGAQMTQAAWMI